MAYRILKPLLITELDSRSCQSFVQDVGSIGRLDLDVFVRVLTQVFVLSILEFECVTKNTG